LAPIFSGLFSMTDPDAGRLLESARRALAQGLPDLAERAYAQALALDPAAIEPRRFLATLALTQGRPGDAVALLEPSIDASQDADLWRQLAQARAALGDFEGARAAFERTVAIDPQQFIAWLNLGHLHEGGGRDHESVLAYFRAVNAAQAQGRWLSDETTAPALRTRVRAAMGVIDRGRRALFDASLEPLRQRFGPEALRRVEKCLAVYLGEIPAQYGDAWQKPKFLFFPDLPTHGFYPRELFPWMEMLEANTGVIAREMEAVLAADSGFEPFIEFRSDAERDFFLRGHREQKPAWDAYFFYRHGERYDDNHARCPRTSEVLRQLPLVEIDEHAPEILYSVLTPGSHILPHRGVTNTRLVCHLPLVVPPDCAIRVGDETRGWDVGHAFAFDDTFEHEAWNRSDETRVVLLVDAWNPYLTEVERLAVHDLVLAIGAFNREGGLKA
jgi:aspartate beta-hydroxylase